mmetsp:Transcript_40260/g.46181  ORF Transcript_40260/g.46181 Transcript_40260/m.46181 type:complete len:105 (+) Transcript_40260:794-1108(+)
MSRLSKDEDLNTFIVHLHITPGLIEDYDELLDAILSQTRNSDPKAIYIVRLKLANLQEEDVDLRNLAKDISTRQRISKPLVHVFNLDSRSDDNSVDLLVNRILY